MIDPNPISPLLDGFTIGNPVNDHFGVCCFPAVKEDSDRKYIIKVISIPASQTQLDALLFTGAYRDPAQAAEYFHTLSEDIVRESQLLMQLSRLDGFLPFEGCQVEPMQKNHIGYDVYLLAGFRLSLERYMHRQNVTHLEAVNLGIDLCAALAACRKAGMLYIDLKPSNIYISPKKEFKIGDLGFVPMDSLKFTAMPAKYRSLYTAPELMDDLSVMNTTADTYSLGMILYQLFNNGVLPGEPSADFPAPMHADEAIAAIIMKAVAPKIEDRWENPEQMQEALIAYMQTHSINHTPIMAPMPGSAAGQRGVTTFETAKFPVPTAAQIQAQQEEAAPEAEAADTSAEEAEAADVPAEEAGETPAAVPEEAPAEEAAENAAAETVTDEPAADEAASDEAAADEAVAEEAPAETEDAIDAPADVPTQDAPEAAAPEARVEEFSLQLVYEEEPAVEITPIEIPSAQDFAASIEAAAAAEFAALSGNILPEPEAASIPKEAQPVSEEQTDNEDLAELDRILHTERKPSPKAAQKHPNIKPVVIKQETKKRSPLRFLVTLLLLCLLLACGVWGYLFYTTEYLQNIRSLTTSGSINEMVVAIDSDIADNLLTVTCTDTYGHAITQRVRDGKAVFQNLSPASLYKVQVEVIGLHKLVGTTSDIFTTESVTNVVSFTAASGAEDGSVILNLIVEGHDPDQWQVIYTAEGEPELGQTFSGHTTTITNLTLDKIYRFRLETGRHEAVNGQNSVDFVAGKAVYARDLTVVSCKDGNLTVQWDSAMREYAPTWRVHCTGPNYDETQEVTDYEAVFSGVDIASAYTVEVTAVGMTQTVRVAVSANPITLKDPQIDDSNPEELKLSWDFEGSAPQGGWVLEYTLDNTNLPSVVKCDGTTATVAPRIPGAVYHFTIQAANNVSVFNNVHTYACPQAKSFEGYGIMAGRITVQLLPTPEAENWTFSTVDRNIFTKNFPVGQSISLVLNSQVNFYLDSDEISILYVFRDEAGNALTELVSEEEVNWHDMWVRDDYHYAERTLPAIPSKAGNYTLDIYFDGMLVTSTTVGIY